jgi:gluconolactonase
MPVAAGNIAIEVLDARFAPVVPPDPVLEQLGSGCRWSEGPVWMYEDNSLIWSDILNNRMMRWSEKDGMTVWEENVGFTNGHARDVDGALLHCSHGHRAITRSRTAGRQEVVLDRFQGRRFNSPNDIVVKSDGTWWFTDPPYGIVMPGEGYPGQAELSCCHVFRYDPRAGELSAATSLPKHPNGLAFSPDESLLYVADSSAVILPDGNHCVFVFDVLGGGALANGRRFAEIHPGVPDGLRVDQRGFLYVSTYDSVQVFAPDGVRIGRIPVPEKVANITFGGNNRDHLYICATTSLYRIRLLTRGVQLP